MYISNELGFKTTLRQACEITLKSIEEKATKNTEADFAKNSNSARSVLLSMLKSNSPDLDKPLVSSGFRSTDNDGLVSLYYSLKSEGLSFDTSALSSSTVNFAIGINR